MHAGRRTRSVLVGILAASALSVVVAPPAAGAPVVVVTPSTGLVDGQAVEIAMTDFPAGLWAVLQCRGSFDISTQSVLDHCNFLVTPTEGTPPATVTGNVKASLGVSGSPIDCATVIDACKVVASTYDTPTNSYVYAEVPISFEGADPPPLPSVSVTPTRVVDGQTVTITASGFPSGTWGIAQCPAGLPLDTTTAIFANCRWMLGPATGTPPESSFGVVLASFPTIDGSRTVDCRLEPGGCTVGVGVLTSGGIISASVPIDFGSAVFVEPARGLADGSVVSASTTADDGDYTLAQCRASVLDQGSGPSDALCGPTTAVVVAGGAITPAFTVDEPLVTRDGASSACGSHGCVLVLETTGGDLEGSAAVSFGSPTLATDPPLPLPAESVVTVQVTGMPGTSVDLSRCVEPISPTRCYGAATITLDAWGAGSASNVWLPTTIFAEGTEHDCRVDSCVLIAGDPAAPLAVLPVRFTPPAVVTLTPSTGLLDGQTMHLDATGLRPDSTYSLWRCTAFRSACDAVDLELPTGPDGTASTDLTAQQRISTYGYCRAGCVVLLFGNGDQAEGTFSMAAGSLAVTPSTGLVPGQAVVVDGSSLMPTYAGPNLGPFPTGDWVVAQCDAAVVGQLSLVGAFQHCSLGPSLQRVTIGGSTLDASANVEGVITKILGGTTDCTAAPGACVLGLFRFEQDGSTSGHTVPLSFG